MAVTLSPGMKIILGSVLLILSRNCPPCGKLSVAGDCAYTVPGEETIMAVPKSSAGKLFFIGYLIETANAGKATGVLKAETIVF